jgi:hypothetical protein
MGHKVVMVGNLGVQNGEGAIRKRAEDAVEVSLS